MLPPGDFNRISGSPMTYMADVAVSEVPSTVSKAPTATFNRKKLPPQLTRFQVELQEPHRIYFAGDEIKGHVQVDLSESLPIQGIILRIVGEAYVNVSDEPRPWTTRRISKIKTTFRNRKISPSSICEKIDSVEEGFFFGSEPSTNWDTATVATVTTVTLPRSQRSTLQRDQNVPPAPNSKSRHQQDSNRRFRSHEKYFEHRAYLFGHKYSSTREMMWTGNHTFPFSYCLPTKLPASFHGRFGYVRYFCEASLERHNLPTIQRRAFFSVNNIVDLNTDSKADSGVSKEKKTNSWCFCCATGTIIVSARVRRRGFVPGETVPIQAHILNVSNKTISKISAKIVQIATYYSSKAFRNHADETVVCEKMEGKIPPGESSCWEDTGPQVPPVPPSSTMIDCKLITLGYRLDFELDVMGMKECLVLKMPLRIGTIPLEKTFKRLAESSDDDDAWFSLKTPLPIHLLLKYPNIPEAYSLKCVKGERNVNRYYFRQIPRSMNSMIGINLRMPNAPLQPVITDDSEAYAPRYLAYREAQEDQELEEDTRNKEKFARIEENGGIITENKCPNHLIIQVSPASHNVSPRQSSTHHLVNQMASTYSHFIPDSPGTFGVTSSRTPLGDNDNDFHLRKRLTSSAPSPTLHNTPSFSQECKKEK